MRNIFKAIAATLLYLTAASLHAADLTRQTMDLNGQWQFDQTAHAFPPAEFTRTIPVPGLVHLAEPRIEQYEKFFKTDNEVESVSEFNFLDRDYTPMYSWYRKSIHIDACLEGTQAVLTLKKSQYVTTVYVNGMMAGHDMACYTPLKFNITEFLRFGEDNEILIMVGDRAWLPSQAAGGTDKEKVHYLPGIWDDVFIDFTGKLVVDEALFLPSLENGSVCVKGMIRSFYPPQMVYDGPIADSCSVDIRIKEYVSGRTVAQKHLELNSMRDRRTLFETTLDIEDPHAWSPESPFLYVGEIDIHGPEGKTDTYSDRFGMRDFKTVGKHYYLNGAPYYLRGTNITLQRFFEDPECSDLAWDREWVKRMLIDDTKEVGWNSMRICVGLVPDFWYELCDEYGILLQNEWLYWQKHGWDEQIRKEYTDWIWSDGNHPSIVIWDCMNENWDGFIGSELIPELKRLDPTRVYDAGYMTSDQLGSSDEMDEPHTYLTPELEASSLYGTWEATSDYFPGKLDNWDFYRSVLESDVPQLVNEYGWIWLWRDGRPSKLTLEYYDYFLGRDATAEQRRELQAYWLQCETEWLRAEKDVAGVLAFTHLTNNYGFTGDWYTGRIRDLEKGPVLRWFKHCFAPAAVFLDLEDGRYNKQAKAYKAGQRLDLHMKAVNDDRTVSSGELTVSIVDQKGRTVSRQKMKISIPAIDRTDLNTSITLPKKAAGYLLKAEYKPDGAKDAVMSRRYIRVGECESYSFIDL